MDEESQRTGQRKEERRKEDHESVDKNAVAEMLALLQVRMVAEKR